ncbi:hypothetical protein ACFPRL_24425 [Pseudoclavibacter helvolus]
MQADDAHADSDEQQVTAEAPVGSEPEGDSGGEREVAEVVLEGEQDGRAADDEQGGEEVQDFDSFGCTLRRAGDGRVLRSFAHFPIFAGQVGRAISPCRPSSWPNSRHRYNAPVTIAGCAAIRTSVGETLGRRLTNTTTLGENQPSQAIPGESSLLALTLGAIAATPVRRRDSPRKTIPERLIRCLSEAISIGSARPGARPAPNRDSGAVLARYSAATATTSPPRLRRDSLRSFASDPSTAGRTRERHSSVCERPHQGLRAQAQGSREATELRNAEI